MSKKPEHNDYEAAGVVEGRRIRKMTDLMDDKMKADMPDQVARDTLDTFVENRQAKIEQWLEENNFLLERLLTRIQSGDEHPDEDVLNFVINECIIGSLIGKREDRLKAIAQLSKIKGFEKQVVEHNPASYAQTIAGLFKFGRS